MAAGKATSYALNSWTGTFTTFSTWETALWRFGTRARFTWTTTGGTRSAFAGRARKCTRWWSTTRWRRLWRRAIRCTWSWTEFCTSAASSRTCTRDCPLTRSCLALDSRVAWRRSTWPTFRRTSSKTPSFRARWSSRAARVQRSAAKMHAPTGELASSSGTPMHVNATWRPTLAQLAMTVGKVPAVPGDYIH